MSTAVENTEAVILSRAIDPAKADWSAEAARSILAISLPAEDLQRADELAAKARAQSLTAQEEAELENYRDVGRLLELLQSKARLSLQRHRRD